MVPTVSAVDIKLLTSQIINLLGQTFQRLFIFACMPCRFPTQRSPQSPSWLGQKARRLFHFKRQISPMGLSCSCVSSSVSSNARPYEPDAQRAARSGRARLAPCHKPHHPSLGGDNDRQLASSTVESRYLARRASKAATGSSMP